VPAISSPIDPETLAALRRDDERALERLFRDQYDTLITEAIGVVIDGAAAAQTVESVFVRVWKERQSFQTPEELAVFLHTTVHEAAVRKQSRRAAVRRFEAHEGGRDSGGHSKDTPTVDAAWLQLASAIHAPADHNAAIRESAQHSRHEAAEHLTAIAKPPGRVKPVALVAGVVVVAGLLWWGKHVLDVAAVDTYISAADARVVESPAGKLADANLLDSTKVRLAGDSRLRIPAKFPAELRVVGLQGAASFTVAAGHPQPFEVRTTRAAIRATGTVFSVRAYPSDDNDIVRVSQGQVEVKTGKGTRTVAVGAALAIDKDGVMQEPAAPVLEEALAWMDGYLILRERPLRDVLPELKYAYGINVYPKDSTLLTRKVTMRASLDSVRKAIAALESSAGLHFGYEGNKMILMDAAEAKKSEAATPKKGANKKN
jgi:ferric-dicitrate binding protein FerR (iron transport regulator)